FSKNGQVFFHIFWVVTLIMQSRQCIVRSESFDEINFLEREWLTSCFKKRLYDYF
ncbi:alpha/beta hydrolase, partial [Lacticaseibacillus paracasei]